MTDRCEECAGVGCVYAYGGAWFPDWKKPHSFQFRIITADPYQCFWCDGTGRRPVELTHAESHDRITQAVEATR